MDQKDPPFLRNRPNVTARALVERDGKYLMIFARWCERWTLPGGRIDGTETAEQTIEREIEEELHVKPASVRFLGFGQGAQYGESIKCAPPKLHLIFHVTTKNLPIVDKEEASDAKWVTIDEMKAMNNKEDGIDDFFHRFPEALR